METQRRGLKVIMNTTTRYMIKSDLVDVTDIARRAGALGWVEADFLRHARMRNVVMYVSVRGGRILGFMSIRLRSKEFEILNMAVHPDFQGHRVGKQMIDRVIKKLHQGRRDRIVLSVPERDLGMQMFLKHADFRATSVQRGKYGEDDSFIFERKATDVLAMGHDDVVVANG